MKLEIRQGDTLVVTYKGEMVTIYAARDGLSLSRKINGAHVPVAPDKDVVRVRLGQSPLLLAYRCPGAKPGDLVRVVLPGNRVHYTYVEALGRGSYSGPLKDAELVVKP